MTELEEAQEELRAAKIMLGYLVKQHDRELRIDISDYSDFYDEANEYELLRYYDLRTDEMVLELRKFNGNH